MLGLHPQSERPYKIVTCPIPGLREEDLLEEASLVQEDSGSVIQQSLDSHKIGLHSQELADDHSDRSLS